MSITLSYFLGNNALFYTEQYFISIKSQKISFNEVYGTNALHAFTH